MCKHFYRIYTSIIYFISLIIFVIVWSFLRFSIQVRQVSESLLGKVVVAGSSQHSQTRTTPVMRRMQQSIHPARLSDATHSSEASRTIGGRDERGREEAFTDTVVQYCFDRRGQNKKRRIQKTFHWRVVKSHHRSLADTYWWGNITGI